MHSFAYYCILLCESEVNANHLRDVIISSKKEEEKDIVEQRY